MGTFHVRVHELLDSGDSVTIFCFCTERTLWTPERFECFPRNNRLWDTATHFRCWKCGRLGMVRDMDVHASPVASVREERRPRPPRQAPLINAQRAFGRRTRALRAEES